MIENKIVENQENTNPVDIAPVIDITNIIGVVSVIEIGTEIAVIAMILVVHILTIEKSEEETEIESKAIDTMIKRGKEIEKNVIVGAGAEVHPMKKKIVDMNVMTAKTAICELTH